MNAVQLAGVLADRYQKKYGEGIDDIKLHKMLYLAQRESLVLTNKPLFADEIYAWQFGPVVHNVRIARLKDELPTGIDESLLTDNEKACLDHVFENYAEKKSWSLMRLTHGEYSWRHARSSENAGGGHRLMPVADIKVDAELAKVCRAMREKRGMP